MNPWSRRPAPGDGELERALAELAEVVEYPEAPDLAASVRRRLERDAAARPAGRPRRVWPRLRVALVVLVVAALVLVAFPGPRAAVARLWDLIGVEIRRGEVPPSLGSAPPTSVGQAPGATLGLGVAVTLEEAAALARAPIPLPAGLGRPDAVWYSPYGAGSVVSLVYEPRPGLPASPHSGVGLLLSVIADPQADVGFFFKKIESDRDNAPEVEVFSRDGQLWYWVPGRHALYTGYPGLRDGRLAGSTLLWQRGGRTYRLEAQVSREEALRLASSLR